MTRLTILLPDDLLSTLHTSAAELKADVRLAAAIEWYRRGVLSQGRAAEVAGIPRADFIDALAQRGFDVVQLAPEDLDRELSDA